MDISGADFTYLCTPAPRKVVLTRSVFRWLRDAIRREQKEHGGPITRFTTLDAYHPTKALCICDMTFVEEPR